MQTETTFAPSAGSPLAPILSGLIALVVAMDGHKAPSAAATAFHKAIRRKGYELAQVAGIEVLDYALAFIRDQAPNPTTADHREAVLTEAWAGLAGWRS
ncbi:hypothetical protein [Methylobacterium sp. Leaf85]|uniref:hypothetical protein n=1 Tax=Methylobacterium sp. Leaf85 TaxID=1736241 RepID=UPI0006FBFC94|nr:hypothetical protein [Methylobacterium sp. Leaf85]KQO49940.1 hypothetical protein ASF08_22645 [Methylobacterium sp. Leaf85]